MSVHILHNTARGDLGARIGDVFFAEPLFDALPDVVFFVKDRAGRYVVVNQTLARRCGMRDKAGLLGKTANEAFAAPLGQRFQAQDQSVLDEGVQIEDQLTRHRYTNRDPGWCLTQKPPLRDAHGAIVGLAGVSRDLAMAVARPTAARSAS